MRTLVLLSLAACAGDKSDTGSTSGQGTSGSGASGGTGGTSGSGTSGGTTSYESGCITVDGAGGYAWVNDAIAVADAGSTINLCAAAAHEEAIVIDKPVAIVGPGTDAFVLVAPTNTHGVTFAAGADGASLSGIAVSTTRSGVLIEGVSGAQVADVQVVEAGNWGVSLEGSEDAVLEGLDLLGNGYGGISVDDASVTIRDSELTQNIFYGIHATDGAAVTLENVSVSSTTYTGTATDLDGIGVFLEGYSSLDSSGGTFAANDVVQVWGDTADLTLSGDVLTGGVYGIVAIENDVVAEDVTITDAYSIGLYDVGSTATLQFSGVISGDPALTAEVGDSEWGGEKYGITGVGALVLASEATITDTTVSGYNHAGMLLGPYDDTLIATLDGVTLEDNGRRGIWAELADLSMNDTFITGTRDVEGYGANACSVLEGVAGLYAYSSTVSWTGSEKKGPTSGVSDSAGHGLSTVLGSTTLDGLEVSAHGCAGILNFQGDLTVLNSSFTEAAGGALLGSSIVDYLGLGLVVEDTRFTANQHQGAFTQELDYTTHHGFTLTETYSEEYPANSDMFLYFSPQARISGATFSEGDNGIVAWGSNVEITDVSWTDYRGTIINADDYADTSGTVASTVVMDGAQISGFAGPGVYCYGSSLEMEDVELSGGRSYSYEYSYEYDYGDGFPTTGSWTSSSTGYGLYGSDCPLALNQTSISDIDAYGIIAYWWSDDAEIELDDVSVSDVSVSLPGVYTGAYLYASVGGTALLNDVSVSGADTATGLSLSTSGTFDLYASDITIDGVAGTGLYLSGSDMTTTMDEVVITDVGSAGVSVQGGAVSMTDSAVTGSGSSGLQLSSTVADVSDNLLTGNSAWGMTCSATTLQTCADNDLSENALGEHSGCDDACGQPDESEIPVKEPPGR